MRKIVGLIAAMGALCVQGAIPAAVHAADKPAEASLPKEAKAQLLNFLKNQNSTGFLVFQDGKILLEQYWPAPTGIPAFTVFLHGKTRQGVLLEDVASQQKSFVSVLIAIAMDKGLIDPEKSVTSYIGAGWSKATAEQEAKIRVVDLLTMSSGLNDAFEYTAPPATVFHYNTPVYAVTKRILEAASKQPLDTITRDWLTVPAGMTDTAWMKRPAAMASVGNDTGLVTTPRDTALFGVVILNNGIAGNGKRIVSEARMKAMFTRSATNPAYGQLWWLNGSDYYMRALAGRTEGQLVPAAPADMVGAFGLFERRLYVVPSRRLIIVRTGAGATVKDFDQQLWLRLNKVIGG